MPRPKEKKHRRQNDRRHWLNEFEEFRRRFETHEQEKTQEETKDDETES